MIPKVMLKTLAVVLCRQLNYFPAKNGMSDYFSPHMLMNRENIDYNKHCKFTFGEYVQAYQEEEKKNDNKPCTIDGIYLQPCFKSSGGHYIMNIATGARMHKKVLWSVPIVGKCVFTRNKTGGIPFPDSTVTETRKLFDFKPHNFAQIHFFFWSGTCYEGY